MIAQVLRGGEIAMGKYRPMRSGQSRLVFLLAVALVACWSGAAPCYGQKPPKKRNITVVRPAPETTPRSNSYYALIIGINDYEFFTPLETPRNDAKEVAAVLHDQYAFKTQVLLDATRDKILDALSQYRSDLHEDDNLLIYYAGHGYFDKPSDLAYWYPVEAGKASTARWINASEITGQTRAIAARHVLVIADSCYSGMMTRTVSPAIDAPLPRDEYIRKLLEQKSRHVLSSGGNEPVADRDTQGHPTGHSVFANVLLEALRDLRESVWDA